jgi:alkylation response protein AidB-like acyl-CoA dehydrogenase
MDFSYPPEAEAFRAELRAWLEANLDARFRAAGTARGLASGPERIALSPGPERVALLKEWNARLADAGYAAIHWPPEHGGRGAGVIEQVVWAEEMQRAKAPPTVNPIGLANIAPAIMAHGTAAQQQRFLRPMLRGEEIWSQGFSEPGAGSDLAALRTRAVRDGDHWVVNGQKTWNSLGELADWCQLLVRTDPAAPKHRGISCLLVDLHSPGVEVRPITTITGEREFAELFFHDVRVPLDARLGAENEGWRVAMTTLTAERAGVATLHLGVRERIRALIEAAAAVGALADPRRRERLARVYLEGELLRLLSERALSGIVHRRSGPEGSLVKLVWSQTEQRVAEVAAEVLGPATLAGPWAQARLAARSYSIAGGTTQVNKNIVAERVLGLPKSASFASRRAQ